jgi:hypothetical protein
MAHSEEERDRQRTATVVALAGIGPKDELEAMMAAQLLAAHNATMECYRRAMLPEQTFEGRSENLNQANKLSRTYAVLLDALNRHRGKGQQKVKVEHVNVHSGGQAVVGMIGGPRGEGLPRNLRINPMQNKSPTGNDIGWIVPRALDEDEEVLTPRQLAANENLLAWPERFPAERVREFEYELGQYAFAGQYQQSPTPRKGGIFKREYWQPYVVPATGARKGMWPDFEFVVVSVDSAFTEKEENDPTGCTTWGVWTDGYELGQYAFAQLHRRRRRLCL